MIELAQISIIFKIENNDNNLENKTKRKKQTVTNIKEIFKDILEGSDNIISHGYFF